MQTPVLVRVSGLPASAMDCFHSDLLNSRLQTRELLEHRLADLRTDLVHQLYDLVEGAEEDRRHFFLAIKRDAFNGRPLAKRQRHVRWQDLQGDAKELADQILELEAEIDQRHREDGLAYDATLHEQRTSLLSLLSQGPWIRGVAMASQVLARQASRLERRPADRWRSKERRAQLGLARYAARTALKTSPFSTLTVLGYGELDDGGSIRFTAAEPAWQRHSLVRAQRYLVDQMVEALELYTPWRDRQQVRCNSTLEEIGDGRSRLLRPAFWQLDSELGKLRQQQMAIVKIRLDPLQVKALRALLNSRLRWSELRDAWASEQGLDIDEAEAGLERLRKVGVIELERPWPTFVEHLEVHLLAGLNELPLVDPALDVARTALATWLDDQKLLAEPDHSPASTMEQLAAGLDRVWAAIVPLAGWPEGTKPARFRDDHFFEDVFVTPPDSTTPLLRIPRSGLHAAQSAARAQIRIAHLFDSRLELQLALGELARRLDPAGLGISLLTFFAEAQATWRTGRKYRRGSSDGPYDPFRLDAVKRLEEARKQVAQAVRETKVHDKDEDRLPLAAVESILSQIPPDLRSLIGTCSFLLPLDPGGERWVAHWTHEGTGRFSSRFSSSMPADLRSAFTERLRTGSRLSDFDGESTELLDLMACRLNNLNVHEPQTNRLLEIPGETTGLSQERRVGIEKLRVITVEGWPRLVDESGGRLLPVHLGGVDHRLLTVVHKFLSDLGPGDLRGTVPSASKRQDGDVLVTARMVLGSLIIRRKRWVVPTAGLIETITNLDDREAFEAVDRWRRSRNLPDRVFLIERLIHGPGRASYKPQYVDFTSPIFVDVLRNALRANAEHIDIEEMLPATGNQPVDPGGQSWVVEVLADDLVIGADNAAPERFMDARRGRSNLYADIGVGSQQTPHRGADALGVLHNE